FTRDWSSDVCSSDLYKPDVIFTLRTSISGGKLVFIGERGAIADAVNPDLKVPEGAVVQINLINDDGATHDIAVPEFHAHSDQIGSTERRVGEGWRPR